MGLRCVLDRLGVGRIDDLISSPLSIGMRLLHHIIRRIFIPKTGRFDFVSERELAMMYHLIQSIPMNLLDMMIV